MNNQRAGAAISSLVLGACALILALKLDLAPSYSDFIVGNITWAAQTKFQDLIAWPAFIAVSFLSFTYLSSRLSEVRNAHSIESSSRLAIQLILWSLPFYAGLGLLVHGVPPHSYTIALSAAGLVFLGAISLSSNRNQYGPEPEVWGIAFFAIALLAFIPYEIAMLVGRTQLSSIGVAQLKSATSASYALLLTTLVVTLIIHAKRNTSFHAYVRSIVLLGQIGLPIFFLTLYPASLQQPTGEIANYQTSIYLKVLIAVVIVIALLDVANRFRLHSKTGEIGKLISPFALLGLLIALKVGVTVAPGISADDYHFGEQLLGWWSYLRGATPYVDYIPAHGFVDDDFKSLLNTVFYDGSAASLNESGRLAFAFLGSIAFISLYSYSGSLTLAFVLVLLLGGRLTWYFLIPFICVWLASSLRHSPAKWLVVWILTVPIVILGVPAHGLLLVAGFSFLAAKLAWDLVRTSGFISWALVGGAALLVLLFGLTTPLFTMLWGATKYVLENGPINQIAYGLPWNLSWEPPARRNAIGELVRMSWVALPIACLYVIYKYRRDWSNAQSPLFPAIAFLVFSMLLTPYSMGRIDAVGPSRPGLASIFSWAVLFPLMVWKITKPHARAVNLLFVVFICSVSGFATTSFSNLLASTASAVQTASLRDGAKYGLPNVGRGYVDEKQWDRLTRLDALLKSRLAPNESYLDLSSRNAHYFYTNRTPILPISAPYNLVPYAQQKRAVALLADLPKMALLQADNVIHDGGGLALRNPYLYKFVVEHYTPRFERGFIVGYPNSDSAGRNGNAINAAIGDITDQNWINGIHRSDAALILSDPHLASMLKAGDKVRFKNGEIRLINRVSGDPAAVYFDGNPISVEVSGVSDAVDLIVSTQTQKEYKSSLFQRSLSVSDLKKIPVSWGRSAHSLGDRMTLVRGMDETEPSLSQLSSENGVYSVKGNDPQVRFDVSNFGISGRDAGLLKFDFRCIDKTAEPRLQVFWWGDERTAPFQVSSVRLSAENGTLIIPLDASPWWLTLNKIKGIRIDLDNAATCRGFSIGQIGLYQRHP